MLWSFIMFSQLGLSERKCLKISLERICTWIFFKAQSALSDYMGLVLNCLMIHGLSSPCLKSSQTIRFLKLDFVSLRDSRIQDMLTLVCKCLVNMAPFYLTSLFHVRISNYNLRGVKKLIVPKMATATFRLNAFQCLAISNWNSLPDETRSAPDLNTFVRMYKAV